MNATMIKGERSKLLAVAVIIAMVACALVAFMPTSDAADESGYDDITPDDFLALAEEGVITLEQSYNVTGPVTVSSDLKLVMNHNSLTTSGDLFYLGANDITLEIVGDKDSKVIAGQSGQASITWGGDYNGSLIVSGGYYSADYSFVWNGTGSEGKVVFENATIEGTTTGPWISYRSNASLVIENCDITAGGIGIYCATVKEATISGTTVTVSGESENVGSALEIKAGNVTITDSDFSTDGYLVDSSIGQSQSGGGISAITVNDGYIGSAGVESVSVEIDSLTTAIVNGYEGAKPLIVTAGNNAPISIDWAAHDASDIVIINGDNAGTVTVEGTSVVSGDSLEDALVGEDESVYISSGTVVSFEIPADKTVAIGPDTNISDNTVISLATGSVLTADLKTPSSFTVNNGVNSIEFNGITGQIIIRQGSVEIAGTIEGDASASGSSIVISGEARLIGNLTIDAEVTMSIAQGATLDLAGYTITNNGNINLMGGSITGEGTICGSAAELVTVYSGDISGVTFDISDVTGGAITTVAGAGVTTISDITIKADADSTADRGIYVNQTAATGSVTISNVTFDFAGTSILPVNADVNADTTFTVDSLTYKDVARENKFVVNATTPVTIGSEGKINFSNAGDAALWSSNTAAGNTFTVAGDIVFDADVTVTSGGSLVIPAGSTASVADGATFIIDGKVAGILDNQGSVVFEKNADVGGATIGGDISVAEGHTLTTYPYMPDGTMFPYNGMTYEIFHVAIGGVEYQYGLSPQPIEYNGLPILNTTVSVDFEVFPDGKYTMTSLTSTVMWYNTTDNNYVGQLKDSEGNIVVDAGFYPNAIYYNASVRIVDTTTTPDGVIISDSAPIQQFLGFTIDPRESVVIVGKPADSELESVTLDETKENTYKVSGTLVYDDGYTLTVSVASGVSGITLVGSMFEMAMENGTLTFNFGDTVPKTVEFKVDFDGTFDQDAKPNNWTTETYTLDLSGLTFERDVSIVLNTDKDEGLAVDGATVTVDDGDLIFTDGEYKTAIGSVTAAPAGETGYQYYVDATGALKYFKADAGNYFLPFKVVGLLEGATVTLNGVAYPTEEGTDYRDFLVDVNSTLAYIELVVDQDGDASDSTYPAVTYRIMLSDLKLESAVDIANGTNNTAFDVTDISDLATFENIKIEGKDVTITADLKYKANYGLYSLDTKINSGWFIPWQISSAVGTDIKIATGIWDYPTGTIDSKSYAAGDLDGYMLTKYAYPGANKLTIDLDGDAADSKYIPATYTINFDVECEVITGYYADATEAYKALHDTYGFTGVSNEEVSNGVAAKTMFIIFNPLGEKDMDATLDYIDVKGILAQDLVFDNVTGRALWYFSFDETNYSYIGKDTVNQNSSTFQTYLNDYRNLAGGVYTMTIKAGETTVATGDVGITGIVAAGYSETTSGAIGSIGAYCDDTVTITGDQVIWVVWYSAVAQDATLGLTLGEKDINGMTACDDDNTVGYHYGYKSFKDDAQNPIQYGEEYIVSVTVDNMEDTISVIPVNKDSYTIVLDEGWFDFPEGVDEDTVYDIEMTMSAGEKLYLPNTAYADKTLLNWALVDENNEPIRTYNGGSLVVIGQVPGVDGQEYHFVAVYSDDTSSTTGGAITEYQLDVTVTDGVISIDTKKADGDDGSVNALAQFLYKVTIMNDEYPEGKDFYYSSSLIYGGPTSEDRDITNLANMLDAGTVVYVTLITEANGHEVFYGSDSAMII